MTRLERNKLSNLILEYVKSQVNNDLFYEECSCWYVDYAGFTARQLKKFVSRHFGFNIKVETIKHALNELEHANGIYYIPRK